MYKGLNMQEKYQGELGFYAVLCHYLLDKYCDGKITIPYGEWFDLAGKDVSITYPPVQNEDKSFTVESKAYWKIDKVENK